MQQTETTVGLPLTLKIGNLFFSIGFVDAAVERGARAFGWCDTDEQRIRISNRLTPSKQADTFLHEVIHALYWYFSIPENAPEERICQNISSGINMVFFDNPDWFQWYSKAIHNTATVDTKQ